MPGTESNIVFALGLDTRYAQLPYHVLQYNWLYCQLAVPLEPEPVPVQV